MIPSIRLMLSRLFLERADGRGVQFLRYALVSGINLAVDFGALYALTEHAGLHYLVSAPISYGLGMATNYLFSIFWVFPRKRLRSRALEALVFVAIGLTGMALNELLLWLFTAVLLLHYLVSRLLSALIGFVWKFAARKVILFS